MKKKFKTFTEIYKKACKLLVIGEVLPDIAATGSWRQLF